MSSPSRRTTLIVAAGVAAMLVAANVAGVLRIPGGPLTGGPGFQKYGISSAANVATGTGMFVGIDPINQWPIPVTIERVRLINPTAGIHLVEARLVRPGSPIREGSLGVAYGPTTDLDALGLYTDYEPLPATLAGMASTIDNRMWVALESYKPGEQSSETMVIDYRLGPFSFTVDMHEGFVACVVPMPSGATCSEDVQ